MGTGLVHVGIMNLRAFLLMLVAWSVLQPSATLSNECSINVDPGQDEDFVPIKIMCTAFPNGTLSTRWALTDTEHVELLHMGYNCTVQDEELVDNLYPDWITANQDEKTINVLPIVNNNSSVAMTCYVDGCYAWSSSGTSFPTWIIPMATCQFFTSESPSNSLNVPSSTQTSSVATEISSTSISEATGTPLVTSGGMSVYYLLLLFVFVLIGVLFILVTFLFIWKPMKRRKRDWWLYGGFNKEMLLGNEPHIDPINRRNNDYCETETIVDSLDVEPDPALNKTMAADGGPFVHEQTQQASNCDKRTLSDASDSSENSSDPLESEGSEHMRDDSSTGTQMVENSIGAQQSESEEERLLTSAASNTGAILEGSRNTEALLATTKLHSPPSDAAVTSSHQNDTSTELSTSSSKLTTASKQNTLGQVMSRESSSSHIDKTSYQSTDDRSNQRKLLCESNDEASSTECIPAAENGMLSGVASSGILDGGITMTTRTGDIIDQREAEHEHNLSEAGPNESQEVTDKSTSNLPVLAGSGVSALSQRELSGYGQSSSRQQQQYHDNYISSSDYTSYSSEQGTCTSSRTGYSTGGYLADIEDMAMDSVSLQSELESDQSTEDGDEPRQREEERKSDCEDYDHGEIVGLSIALSHTLRHAHRGKRQQQPQYVHVLSDEDSDPYYAMNAPLNVLDSPSSGYIETCQLNAPQPQGALDSDDGIYEDMTQTIVRSDTSHSGYISMNPPSNFHRQKKKETVV